MWKWIKSKIMTRRQMLANVEEARGTANECLYLVSMHHDRLQDSIQECARLRAENRELRRHVLALEKRLRNLRLDEAAKNLPDKL